MLLGLPLLAAVVVVAGRVGGTARFVTWPIAAFTLLAAMVSLVGVWVGLDRPGLLVAGVLPGLMMAYVLPAAPVTLVAGVLVGLAALAIGARGIAAGTAMTVGAMMVLAVVMQRPAVECRDRASRRAVGHGGFPPRPVRRGLGPALLTAGSRARHRSGITTTPTPASMGG